MTQTPRGFDPHDPHTDLNTPYAEPPEAPPGSGSTVPPAERRASGSDLVSGTAGAAAPAAAPDTRGETPRTETPVPVPEPRQVTRAGMVWVAVACALVVLILLIAFILQNQEYVQVKFFGLEGSVPLGIALFIAAVGGGVLVAIAGAARIIQLRIAAHRARTGRQAGQGTPAR
ncbi:MAG TPA: lipopolysaccharide assembly protein LapA domain-containing protein [Arthrobacter sp.]